MSPPKSINAEVAVNASGLRLNVVSANERTVPPDPIMPVRRPDRPPPTYGSHSPAELELTALRAILHSSSPQQNGYRFQPNEAFYNT